MTPLRRSFEKWYLEHKQMRVRAETTPIGAQTVWAKAWRSGYRAAKREGEWSPPLRKGAKVLQILESRVITLSAEYDGGWAATDEMGYLLWAPTPDLLPLPHAPRKK